MFSLKNLSLLLSLGTTMSLASPVKRADSELAPNDLLPFNWDNILVESGTLPNITTTPELPVPNPLAKRADFCYDYWLDSNKVQDWGSRWQAASGQTWIPALQWRSWAWSDAGIKICAVNRYQEIWAGTNLADWEVGWAMKAIGGDCVEGFQRTKGGRITGHGTDGRALHMYLTDVGFTCY
ncbi:hypothetical protein V8F33_011847 [Rhypophila sp. PSN 637]